jgi:hypothetical protein
MRIGRARRRYHVGGIEIADARRLADAERAGDTVPEGCAWLDARTVDDVELPLVFRAIDRTTTATGAQALWRWLVAPALELEVLARRERWIREFADPVRRDRVREDLAGGALADAPYLPRLLWEPPAPPIVTRRWILSIAAMVVSGALAWWWGPLALVAVVVFAAHVLVDDWAGLQLAQQTRALEVLDDLLAATSRLVHHRILPDDTTHELAGELAAVTSLRRRIAVLAWRDPFGLLDLVRAGLLVRLFVLAGCTRIIEAERARLRRLVIRIGELDAAVAVACLRAERPDAQVPELEVAGAPQIAARSLVHPAIEVAVGNEVVLDDRCLLITGSNMSGKSTFLRTIALQAILAQSIHTTFGSWRASVFRIHAAMRVADDTASGTSTYAAEVAAISELVHAVTTTHARPALFVLDEPFRGTNPTLRIPIVVAVLEYLGARDVVVAATHDLDVAARLVPRFARGHFSELDDAFDYRLREGVAASGNAFALLRRAGYPAAIVERLERGTPDAQRDENTSAITVTIPRA